MASSYLDREQEARVFALRAAADLLYPKPAPATTGTWTQITGSVPPLQWWPLVQTAAFITTGDILTEDEEDTDDDD